MARIGLACPCCQGLDPDIAGIMENFPVGRIYTVVCRGKEFVEGTSNQIERCCKYYLMKDSKGCVWAAPSQRDFDKVLAEVEEREDDE